VMDGRTDPDRRPDGAAAGSGRPAPSLADLRRYAQCGRLLPPGPEPRCQGAEGPRGHPQRGPLRGAVGPAGRDDCAVHPGQRAVAAAKATGGRLMHGPIEVPGGSWIALMMDPQGGAFAVQEAPRPATQPRPATAASAAPRPATAPKPAMAPQPTAAPMRAASA